MRTETLKVDGVTCGACVTAVTRALKSVEGVKDVAVSLTPGEARIQFDESTTSPEHLRMTVKKAGSGVDITVDKNRGKGGCGN